MKADKRYYLNADRSKVVDEHDPDAAYLLAAEGGDISTEDAKKYGIGHYAPKADDEMPADEPEAKMVPAPPENKAVQMGDTVKSGRDKK